MPRAIWTGSIGFGLVNVPVRMYSAIEEQDLHFHYVHEPDGSRIAYQKVCRAEDRPVPDDEIVKAFELAKGEYVYMADEDFEAAQADGGRTIDIRAFVPYEEIDPIFFEKTYTSARQEGGERVYALLVEAMENSGLAGIAKFVMRDRQHLGCLRVREGVITLERMHFADEIRATDEIAPEGTKVEKQELELAASLIERYTRRLRAREVPRHVPRRALRDHQGEAEGRGRARAGRGEGGGAGRPHGGAARERRGCGASAWRWTQGRRRARRQARQALKG